MDSNQRPRSYQGLYQKPTEISPSQIRNARCAASFFEIRLRSILCPSGTSYRRRNFPYNSLDVVELNGPL